MRQGEIRDNLLGQLQHLLDANWIAREFNHLPVLTEDFYCRADSRDKEIGPGYSSLPELFKTRTNPSLESASDIIEVANVLKRSWSTYQTHRRGKRGLTNSASPCGELTPYGPGRG